METDISPDASVIQRNQELMRDFERALERNPAVNLTALIPDSYLQNHPDAHPPSIVTSTAKHNQRTIDELQFFFRHDPEVDLLEVFPRNYARRRGFARQIDGNLAEPKKTEPLAPPDFRRHFNDVETAEIIFPLSNDATAMLTTFSDFSDGWMDSEHSLVPVLQRMLWNCKKIWEAPTRGIVVQCNDEIVAKVISTKGDYTEYTALQYLAEQAPEIPAPRPHGLIKFGYFCIIFQSYVPSMTLTKVWPSLTHDDKIHVRNQLEDIFKKLRSIRKKEGHPLGGVGGEGVKDYKGDTIVNTAAQFEDFVFSTPHHGSNTYATFLCSFLTDSIQGSVFTHGDIRQDNIMVKLSQDNGWVVTGLIDWEDSGFYPEYHECTQLTRTLSVVDEDDWYLYLPASISPLQFPIRWLVDRLYDIHTKTT